MIISTYYFFAGAGVAGAIGFAEGAVGFGAGVVAAGIPAFPFAASTFCDSIPLPVSVGVTTGPASHTDLVAGICSPQAVLLVLLLVV